MGDPSPSDEHEWVVLASNLSFHDAWTALCRGEKVRRPKWWPSAYRSKRGKRIAVRYVGRKATCTFGSNVDDILAHDWQIVRLKFRRKAAQEWRKSQEAKRKEEEEQNRLERERVLLEIAGQQQSLAPPRKRRQPIMTSL